MVGGFGSEWHSRASIPVDTGGNLRKNTALASSTYAEALEMVLLEMSIVPMGVGQSVSPYVAECVDLVDKSGLDYEVHSMGTIVEGELDAVLGLMRACIEQMAKHSDRVTCASKLD